MIHLQHLHGNTVAQQQTQQLVGIYGGIDSLCIPVMLTPNSNDCDPAALKVLTRSFQ